MDVQLVEVHASIYELDACYDPGRSYMVAVPVGSPPVTSDASKVLYVRVRVDGYYEDGAVWCPAMISCPAHGACSASSSSACIIENAVVVSMVSP